MKRLCIFSFYDGEGLVDKSVEYLLKELCFNTDRMVIVVNGEIEDGERKRLEAYTKDILIRDNVGYDAGAYKSAMFDYLKVEEIKQYEELILCNDTFIGPFIPFRDIFSDMEKRTCDFWGITAVEWNLFPHIQSYFLVFNKTVIRDDSFFTYWKGGIDETTQVLEDVYAQFEMGLFHYLTKVKKKTYSVYVPEKTYNFYTGVSVGMKKYHLPLIKKKTLKNFDDNKDDIIAAIRYIEKRSSYPIEYILEYIQRFNLCEITKEQILEYVIEESNIKETYFVGAEITTDTLKERIDACKEFYIYGCGTWARRIYWNLCRDKESFRGFLVSDKKELKYEKVYGVDIIQIDSVAIDKTCKIVIGVNKENTLDILKGYLSHIPREQIISLYPDTIGN